MDVSVSRLAISECAAMEKSVRFAQRYWAYGRGEKCTAPCLQGVSKEFVLIAKANGVTCKYRKLLATCGSADVLDLYLYI